MKTRVKRAPRKSGRKSGSKLQGAVDLARERWQAAKKSAKQAKHAAKQARRQFKDTKKLLKRAKEEMLAAARTLQSSVVSAVRGRKKARAKTVAKPAAKAAVKPAAKRASKRDAKPATKTIAKPVAPARRKAPVSKTPGARKTGACGSRVDSVDRTRESAGAGDDRGMTWRRTCHFYDSYATRTITPSISPPLPSHASSPPASGRT